jgi:hypothetical protein
MQPNPSCCCAGSEHPLLKLDLLIYPIFWSNSRISRHGLMLPHERHHLTRDSTALPGTPFLRSQKKVRITFHIPRYRISQFKAESDRKISGGTKPIIDTATISLPSSSIIVRAITAKIPRFVVLRQTSPARNHNCWWCDSENRM